jgi:hypothetical protein
MVTLSVSVTFSMKRISTQKIILSLVPVIGLLPLMAQVQGTLYVSNLGQTPTGSASIGSDAWVILAELPMGGIFRLVIIIRLMV